MTVVQINAKAKTIRGILIEEMLRAGADVGSMLRDPSMLAAVNLWCQLQADKIDHTTIGADWLRDAIQFA